MKNTRDVFICFEAALLVVWQNVMAHFHSVALVASWH